MSDHEFLPVLQVALFLFCVWAVGSACKLIHASPIIGEILVGVILGPPVLNIVPYPQAFNLVGKIGIMLMLASAGMQFDVRLFLKVAPNAAAIAVLGTIGPLVFGGLVMLALDYDWYPTAIAAGIAISPNSIGLVTKLLSEAKVMQSELGRLMFTAAFCLDVVALTAVSLFDSITSSKSVHASDLLLPMLYTLLFITAGFIVAVFLIPPLIDALLARIPDFPISNKTNFHDQVLTTCALALIVAYSYVGSVVASYLLGAFMAGMALFHSHTTRQAWLRFLKRMIDWFIRIFFAASIGFTVPVSIMLTGSAFAQGFFLFLGAMLGKVICGVGAPRDKLLVGMGLSGRGEFSYVVAAEFAVHYVEGDAPSRPLLSSSAYTVVMWALLLTTLFAPLSFRWYLRYCLKHGIASSAIDDRTAAAATAATAAAAASSGTTAVIISSDDEAHLSTNSTPHDDLNSAPPSIIISPFSGVAYPSVSTPSSLRVITPGVLVTTTAMTETDTPPTGSPHAGPLSSLVSFSSSSDLGQVSIQEDSMFALARR